MGSPRLTARVAASATSGSAPSSWESRARFKSSNASKAPCRRSPLGPSKTTSPSSPSPRTTQRDREPCRSALPRRLSAPLDQEPPVDERAQDLVERLFDAFNRRDADEIVALCDERMEF